MQSQGRSVGTGFKAVSGSNRHWNPIVYSDLRRGCRASGSGLGLITEAKMTQCVVLSRHKKLQFVTAERRGGNRLWLLGVYGSGVDQHDGDVVLDWINTAAFATLQTAAVVVESHWLFANRANEHIKKILRNHGAFIVAPT